jgi:hypothetical protein
LAQLKRRIEYVGNFTYGVHYNEVELVFGTECIDEIVVEAPNLVCDTFSLPIPPELS